MTRFPRMFINVLFATLFLFLCGCTAFAPAATITPMLSPTSTLTSTVTPTVTLTPTPTITYTPTPNPTQVSAIDGMVMMFVPAGDFLMGSSDSDLMAWSDETPQHHVYLDAYWIDRTEVTNAMYAICVKTMACQPPRITYSFTRTNYYGFDWMADYPVIVAWNEAQTYCGWAGRRLPTEAEWEKAARGVDGGIYPWGNSSPNSSLLNYNMNVGDTSAVGSYPSGASPYGALDMAGNVAEWIADWYDSSYYSHSPTFNPTGPSSGYFHVLRGGWGDVTLEVRSAFRFFTEPDAVYSFSGFRCVLAIP